MIDQRKVQAVADLVATFTDAEQKALLEQLLNLRTTRQRAEHLARFSGYMAKFEQEGDHVYPYDPATGTVSDQPSFKQGRIERAE